MRDVEDVLVLLHLFIELFNASQLAQSDFDGWLLLYQSFTEPVVPVVQAVGRQQVRNSDTFVKVAASEFQNNVASDVGDRSNNQQTHSIN